MTSKQREQFNRMRDCLRRIGHNYQTTEQLRRDSGDDYGLDYDEALEMSYDNIQQEARNAVCGVREIKPPMPADKGSTVEEGEK